MSNAEVADLRARVAELEAELARRDTRIRELEDALAVLHQKARLREACTGAGDLNQDAPPSADAEPARDVSTGCHRRTRSKPILREHVGVTPAYSTRRPTFSAVPIASPFRPRVES